MLLSILLTIFNYVICFQNNNILLKELYRFGRKTNYRFIPFIPPINDNKSTKFINPIRLFHQQMRIIQLINLLIQLDLFHHQTIIIQLLLIQLNPFYHHQYYSQIHNKFVCTY